MSSHATPLIKIGAILKHSNADKLGIVEVQGFRAVVKLSDFKAGDFAVYIPPDSMVPLTAEFAWLWESRITPGDPVPDKYRRVTARRFRGEWSEGLLMPAKDFGLNCNDEQIGQDVSEQIGITHWNPPEPDDLGGENERGPSSKQSRIWPRSLKGWAFLLIRTVTFGKVGGWGMQGGSNEIAPKNTPPIYDVEALKRFPNIFQEGENVYITEKIHGANSRYVFVPGAFGGKMYVGSRKLWKSKKAKCVWRSILENTPDIERWCRDYPGYTLYGEAVPTQKAGGVDFNYGCTRPTFFLFDIRNPEGRWLEPVEAQILLAGYPGIKRVPVLYEGPWKPGVFPAEGGSLISGANHLREGIVIKTTPMRQDPRLGRVQLKVISNDYYALGS